MGVDPLFLFRRGCGAIVGAARAGGALALAERRRWPLWLPVGMGAGIGLYFLLPVEPSAPEAALAGLAGLICAGGALVSRSLLPRAALALIAALALGFVLAKGRVTRVAAPIVPHKLGPVYVLGRIETVEARPNGTRMVLGDLLIPRLKAVPRRARITIRAKKPALMPGQWVWLHAMLMPPPAPVAPGAYDFGRAAFFQSIGAVGYAYGRAHLAEAWRALSRREKIAAFIEQLRWTMTARIHAVLPGSHGAIAAALITGERDGIAPQDAQSLRDAGLAHVLAIAGLHMALVGLGLFWAIRAILAAIPALALRYPIKKWAALAALLSSAFYLLISGAAASAMRAFIMLAMMLIAILLDRPALSMRAIALAAAIILALRPESLVQPGFQMSFAAVASLIALAEWERAHRLRAVGAPRRRFMGAWRYLRGIAVTSFVGSLATIPYSIFHFGRATHYAVLGNLLAMPIMGFVTMPAAAFCVIAMPFGLERAPLHVMGWGIAMMLHVGRWVSGLPGAVSLVAAWPVGALAVLSLGGLWVVIWRGGWRWLGLLPLMGAIIFAMLTHGPDMLVADDAATVALRGADGRLGFVGAPHDKYAAQAWLQRDGDRRDPLSAAARGQRCDGQGCVLYRKGLVIAISRRFAGFAEDCSHADIVIAAYRAGDCTGPKQVIARENALHDGGYAIHFAPLRVESVAQARGRRPWSRLPQNFNSGG